MDALERDHLRHRVEALDAEVDALRLLVLSLMGEMAARDPDQIMAVAHMVGAAGDAMRSTEPTTEHHQIVAREIDSISQLLQQVLRVSRQH